MYEIFNADYELILECKTIEEVQEYLRNDYKEELRDELYWMDQYPEDYGPEHDPEGAVRERMKDNNFIKINVPFPEF